MRKVIKDLNLNKKTLKVVSAGTWWNNNDKIEFFENVKEVYWTEKNKELYIVFETKAVSTISSFAYIKYEWVEKNETNKKR